MNAIKNLLLQRRHSESSLHKECLHNEIALQIPNIPGENLHLPFQPTKTVIRVIHMNKIEIIISLFFILFRIEGETKNN